MPLAGEAVLSDFCEHFERLHPTHPVVLELQTGAVHPGALVPLLIHGDGGRHYRKSEILVVQWQSMIGRGTRESAQGSNKRRLNQDGDDVYAAECNMLGHSFSTRFLIGSMIKKYYKESPATLLKFMGQVSTFCGELYTKGVMHRGVTLKFIVLGCKGDLPYLSKIASMERNFLHTRKKKTKNKPKDLPGICWLCAAGRNDANGEVPYEDFSTEAMWMASQGVHNEKPWLETPTILQSILHDPLQQPSFFTLDIFHILNAGIYKDFVASSLVLILPQLGETSAEKNMDAMNRVLAEFLKQQHVLLHCRFLSLKLIGADSLQKYPVGGWTKGQDSVILMKFIPYLMETIASEVIQDKPFRYIYAGTRAMNQCMQLLYAEGVWMRPAVALEAARNGYNFLNAYSKLVTFTLEEGKRMMYNLVPKLHYWHHIVDELWRISQIPNGPRPLNPVVHSTSQDEDFIGRISRLSRRVKPTHVHRNVIRRYKAALASKLGLLG